MLTHEIRNQLLVDELQLGNRLNQDIQTSDHADFALLLAMSCILQQNTKI